MPSRLDPSIEFLEVLSEGPDVWNAWRAARPYISPINLEHADLEGANLEGANLSKVGLGWAYLPGSNLAGADLSGADLTNANLEGAVLSASNMANATLFKATLRRARLYTTNLTKAKARRANFYRADLGRANLTDACLTESDIQEANLSDALLLRTNFDRAKLNGAILHRADLRDADVSNCSVVEASFEGANLSGCRVYGISAWDVSLTGANQTNLTITRKGDAVITVDDLEVAQFVYMLLNNQKVRNVIDEVSSKLVLILGRFSDRQKQVLDAVRLALRESNYIPVLFDFSKPSTRDLTETVSTLAHLSRFVIADISEPRSIPQELQRIVEQLPSVPVQPIIRSAEHEYALLEHFRRYPWFLEVARYDDLEDLLATFVERVVAPAERFLNTARG